VLALYLIDKTSILELNSVSYCSEKEKKRKKKEKNVKNIVHSPHEIRNIFADNTQF